MTLLSAFSTRSIDLLGVGCFWLVALVESPWLEARPDGAAPMAFSDESAAMIREGDTALLQ